LIFASRTLTKSRAAEKQKESKRFAVFAYKDAIPTGFGA